MILATLLDVAICTGLLVALVACCLLGRWAIVGRDVSR